MKICKTCIHREVCGFKGKSEYGEPQSCKYYIGEKRKLREESLDDIVPIVLICLAVLVMIVATVFVVVYIRAIINSNLPQWLKIFLITK